jgi:hypothetical protein
MRDDVTTKKNSIVELLKKIHPNTQFKVKEDVGFFFHSDSPSIKRNLVISDLAMNKFGMDILEFQVRHIAKDMTQLGDQKPYIWLCSYSV